MQIKELGIFNNTNFLKLFKPEIFFYLAFGTYFIENFLRFIQYNIPYLYSGILEAIIYTLVIISIISRIKIICQIPKFQLLIYFIGTICCLYLFPDRAILIQWLLIIAATKMRFKDIVKFVFIILSVLLPVVIGSALLGFIDNDVFYRDYSIIHTRYSYGFSNPNIVSAYLLQFIICLLLLRWKNFGKLENISMVVAFYITHVLCNTRTVSILIIFLLIIINAYKYKKVSFSYLKNLAYFSYIFCPAITFYLAFLHNRGYLFTYSLNMILQHRIRNLSYCLDHYKITPFGTLVTRTSDFHVIDNGYGALLITHGYVTLIFFITAYLYLIKRVIKEKNSILLIILTAFLYAGIMENYLWLLYINITLFAFTTITKEPIENLSVTNP